MPSTSWPPEPRPMIPSGEINLALRGIPYEELKSRVETLLGFP